MKNFTQKFQQITTPATLALATLTILSKPALTIEISPSVLNGLYYPNGSQLFFSQGRQQFEKEIENSQKKRLNFPENLLKITSDTPTGQPDNQFQKNTCTTDCHQNPQR
ncbi:MAG TPA: hypothetical protein V6D13_14950 [Halomicronema sp.]